MTDEDARKPDRDGIPGVDREGEFKDKDVPDTGDAPKSPRRVGGFEDKDVESGELGEKVQRHGDFADKDVPDHAPGQEIEPEGEYKDMDPGKDDDEDHDENDARGRDPRDRGGSRDT